jgi:hypothetical protein
MLVSEEENTHPRAPKAMQQQGRKEAGCEGIKKIENTPTLQCT